MSNEFFKINSFEEDEIYEKWRRLTKEEQAAISLRKAQVYVSIDDMDLIQTAFQALLGDTEPRPDGTTDRRIMQMGYALEEVKQRLQKRIDKETKRDG